MVGKRATVAVEPIERPAPCLGARALRFLVSLRKAATMADSRRERCTSFGEALGFPRMDHGVLQELPDAEG